MSASPGRSPQRRPRHQRSSSQNNKLQIRVVPYSPPRLSSDDPSSSRPVSYLDSSPPPVLDYGGHVQDTDSDPGSDTGTGTGTGADVETPSPKKSRAYSNLAPAVDAEHGYASRSRRVHDIWTPSPKPSLAPSSATSWTPTLPNVPTPSPPSSPLSPGSPSLESLSPSGLRRHKTVINVHSDKTFSLLPQSTSASSRTDSLWSPPPSFTTPSSSYTHQSSDILSDTRSGSSLGTSLAQRYLDSLPSTSSLVPLRDSSLGSTSNSNYRWVGGVRKVPGNKLDPGLKDSISSTSSVDQSLPPLAENVSLDPVTTPPLVTKSSFQSSISCSTWSDRTNYRVYASRSSASAVATADGAPTTAAESSLIRGVESLSPSSSHSNYDILGESNSSDQSLGGLSRPRTIESEINYVVHGGSSRPSSSLSAITPTLRPEYSRESLVVAPLNPSRGNFAGSSAANKLPFQYPFGVRPLGQNSNVQRTATRASSASPSLVHTQNGLADHRSESASRGSNSSNPLAAFQQHPWSSRLSTVISDSGGASEPPSRPLSPLADGSRRRSALSSTYRSPLTGLDDDESHRSTVIVQERPGAVYQRGTPREPNFSNVRLVRDPDEDGDGLADLANSHYLSSRNWHSNSLSSYPSDRNLPSPTRSRANSTHQSPIPAWARLYYGSTDRRFLTLQTSSDSMYSMFHDNCPATSFLHRSPSAERFARAICSPLRRPREVASQSNLHELYTGSRGPTSYAALHVVRGLKKQTSSLWSPHLRRDRRLGRSSIWEPRRAVLYQGSSYSDLWNTQVALFVTGFILPLAWILAAFLPLPPTPPLKTMERYLSTSHLDLRYEGAQHIPDIYDARRYHRLKSWRSVNRRMAIVGLFVIGAAVTLVVIGVQQQWRT